MDNTLHHIPNANIEMNDHAKSTLANQAGTYFTRNSPNGASRSISPFLLANKFQFNLYVMYRQLLDIIENKIKNGEKLDDIDLPGIISKKKLK